MSRPFAVLVPDHGPDLVPWDTYRDSVIEEWSAMLDGCPGEPEVHAFFEQHPCMLPDVYAAWGRGHHGPVNGVIFSQPELPGLCRKVPDFMYVARDSSAIHAVLIEIERPDKRHSTQAGEPSAALREARLQISDWRAWFSDASNQLLFKTEYGVHGRDFRLKPRQFFVKYILIFGRRDDALSNERFANARGNDIGHLEMTYDRLSPGERFAGYPVVRLDRSIVPGQIRHRIVGAPARINEWPFWDIDALLTVGLEEAIARNELITPVRRTWIMKKFEERIHAQKYERRR